MKIQRGKEYSEVVDSYCDKYPTTPALTLAKMIAKEHGGSVDNARTAIRYRRGSHGARDAISVSGKARDYSHQKSWIEFKNKLAKERKQNMEPYRLPNKDRSVLLMNDLHFPWVDAEALMLAIEFGKKNKCNTIYLNGDIIDFEEVSRWKGRKRHSTAFELEQVRNFLALLRAEFPKADIYYKMGNHEDRFESYMLNNAEKLLDVPEFQIDKLLHFDKYNIKLIASKQLAFIGKLAVIHGHEYHGMTSPVSPARSLFLKAKQPAIMGHLHRGSKQSGTTIEGKKILCWSVPCLCDLSPLYAPFNEWGHGFAHIVTEKSGKFKVHLYDIIDSEIY